MLDPNFLSDYPSWARFRLITSLWVRLIRLGSSEVTGDRFNYPNRDLILLEELNRFGFVGFQIEDFAKQFLDDANFDWIEEGNERQFDFIANLLDPVTRKESPRRSVEFRGFVRLSSAGLKRACIANIDCLHMVTVQKVALVSKMKELWIENISHDSIFSWYKGDLKQKIEVTWKWFLKNEPELVRGVCEPRTLDDVKKLFDKKTAFRDGKELCLGKIKRKMALDKCARNRKKELAPLYLEISKEAKSRLKEAAERRGRSMAEVVDELILKWCPQDFKF